MARAQSGGLPDAQECTKGFHRLRVGDYRIVYHLEPGQRLRLDYADIRDVVYDVFRTLRALREDGG